MINNTDVNENQDFYPEGNLPLHETNEDSFEQGESKLSVDKLKSYGKKSLSPLVELVHKYQDEISPYFDAISRGLQGGVNSLTKEESNSKNEADKIVAGWFREAADGLSEANSKLKSSNAEEMIDFIDMKAQKNPGFMFSTSYLAGLFFGRVGRHIGRKKFSTRSQSLQ